MTLPLTSHYQSPWLSDFSESVVTLVSSSSSIACMSLQSWIMQIFQTEPVSADDLLTSTVHVKSCL
jgi:hypothetical protein